MDERILTLPEQWARNATTNIPAPPIPGIAYRNAELDAARIAQGQQYSRIADSAEWNQIMYLMSGMIREVEKYGLPRYSAYTNYEIGSLCLDGMIYQCVKQNGPGTPAGTKPTSNSEYWKQAIPSLDNLWLLQRVEEPTELFVNSTTGDDELIPGRGTEEKPFKSISAAIVYVENHLFLANVVTINVAPGDYAESIIVSQIFRSTGGVVIEGQGARLTGQDIQLLFYDSCTVRNFQYKPVRVSLPLSCVLADNGSVDVFQLTIDVAETSFDAGAYTNAFAAQGSGHLRIFDKCVSRAAPTLTARNNVFYCVSGGEVYLARNMILTGAYLYTCVSAESGMFRRDAVTLPTFDGSSVTQAQRYSCWLNAIIVTQGAGANYFPGTTAGQAFNGGQYL